MIEKTPNQDALPQEKFTIGKWECYQFTLHTAILLERIGSPFMQSRYDDKGNPVPIIPSIGQIAETLYVMLNWHKPYINEVLGDPIRFQNEVGALSSQITMREFAVITGQLNAMMASLNNAVSESGVGGTGEKKEGIGSSAS